MSENLIRVASNFVANFQPKWIQVLICMLFRLFFTESFPINKLQKTYPNFTNICTNMFCSSKSRCEQRRCAGI
jgi:hypothetical protein